jgi:hypothetical protein
MRPGTVAPPFEHSDRPPWTNTFPAPPTEACAQRPWGMAAAGIQESVAGRR